MTQFLRITGIVAAGLVALVVLGFVLKIVLLAAVVAVLVLAGMTVANLVRRRNGVTTITMRR